MSCKEESCIGPVSMVTVVSVAAVRDNQLQCSDAGEVDRNKLGIHGSRHVSTVIDVTSVTIRAHFIINADSALKACKSPVEIELYARKAVDSDPFAYCVPLIVRVWPSPAPVSPLLISRSTSPQPFCAETNAMSLAQAVDPAADVRNILASAQSAEGFVSAERQ